MRTPTISRRAFRTASLLAGSLALAGALVAPSPARAHGLPAPPSPRVVHEVIHDGLHDLLRELAYVPTAIERAHERHLQLFFGGRIYEPRHRHEHVVYRFPVWVDGAVTYRPYAYCGGRLYGAPTARPRLWVDWRVAPASHWCDRCHAHYPASHAHFRPVRRERWDDYRLDGRRHDPRHDRRYDRRYDRRCDDRGHHGDDRCDRHGHDHGRSHHRH